jgi:hypothetical protein
MKKINLGIMGVALIVILMITMAAFNVGSVNASPAEKKNPSDLKWVTKYDPNYGNITVREDMVVGNGDDYTIVANYDS